MRKKMDALCCVDPHPQVPTESGRLARPSSHPAPPAAEVASLAAPPAAPPAARGASPTPPKPTPPTPTPPLPPPPVPRRMRRLVGPAATGITRATTTGARRITGRPDPASPRHPCRRAAAPAGRAGPWAGDHRRSASPVGDFFLIFFLGRLLVLDPFLRYHASPALSLSPASPRRTLGMFHRPTPRGLSLRSIRLVAASGSNATRATGRH